MDWNPLCNKKSFIVTTSILKNDKKHRNVGSKMSQMNNLYGKY